MSELISLIRNNNVSEQPHPMLGRQVLIRSNMAGVHTGELLSVNGNKLMLKNAKRLWSWSAKDGIALSGVAMSGLKENSKIDLKTDLHEINGYEEMILVGSGVIL